MIGDMGMVSVKVVVVLTYRTADGQCGMRYESEAQREVEAADIEKTAEDLAGQATFTLPILGKQK